MKPVEVLMVEDNQGDVVLVQAAMEKIGLTHNVTVISDGAEAVEYLHRRGKHAKVAPARADYAGHEASAEKWL